MPGVTNLGFNVVDLSSGGAGGGSTSVSNVLDPSSESTLVYTGTGKRKLDLADIESNTSDEFQVNKKARFTQGVLVEGLNPLDVVLTNGNSELVSEPLQSGFNRTMNDTLVSQSNLWSSEKIDNGFVRKGGDTMQQYLRVSSLGTGFNIPVISLVSTSAATANNVVASYNFRSSSLADVGGLSMVNGTMKLLNGASGELWLLSDFGNKSLGLKVRPSANDVWLEGADLNLNTRAIRNGSIEDATMTHGDLEPSEIVLTDASRRFSTQPPATAFNKNFGRLSDSVLEGSRLDDTVQDLEHVWSGSKVASAIGTAGNAFLPLAGGTLSDNLNMGGNQISNFNSLASVTGAAFIAIGDAASVWTTPTILMNSVLTTTGSVTSGGDVVALTGTVKGSRFELDGIVKYDVVANSHVIEPSVPLYGPLPPYMDSPNTPSPYVASASSEWYEGQYPAWQAFDNSGTSTFGSNQGRYDQVSGLAIGDPTQQTLLSVGGPVVGDWIQIDLGSSKTIGRFDCRNTNTGSIPLDFTIVGGNDGTSWSTVAQVNNSSVGVNNDYILVLQPTTFRFWRTIVRRVQANLYPHVGFANVRFNEVLNMVNDTHIKMPLKVNNVLQDTSRSCIGKMYTVTPYDITYPPTPGTISINPDNLPTVEAFAVNITKTNQGFVIVDAGYYRVDCQYQFVTNGASTWGLAMLVNGARVEPSSKQTYASGEITDLDLCDMVSLDAGDVVSFETSNSGTGTKICNVRSFSVYIEKLRMNS